MIGNGEKLKRNREKAISALLSEAKIASAADRVSMSEATSDVGFSKNFS